MRKSTVEIPGSSGIDTSYAQTASRAAAMLFQGKWRVEIICAMRLGPVRVGQLSRMIPGASKKMLAQTLRRLEADGIVVRRDMSEVVLHVEYDFTIEARQEVCSLLDHLSQWGRKYALAERPAIATSCAKVQLKRTRRSPNHKPRPIRSEG